MYNGARFGLLLAVFYALAFGSAYVPPLNFPALLCLLVLPAALYLRMRHDFRASGGKHTVGTLWLNGLLTVTGGAVLAAVPEVIFLKWIDPTFLPGQIDTMAQALASSSEPQTQQFASDLQNAINNGFTVSPIIFTMSTLWSITFVGSILALISGIAVKAGAGRYKTFIRRDGE